MPPKPLPTIEELPAQPVNAQIENFSHRAEYDELAWAHLQLSVGAAAAELAFSLGLSDKARSELIVSALQRSVGKQVLLRDLFDAATLDTSGPASLVRTDVITSEPAKVIDLTEYRQTHHPEVSTEPSTPVTKVRRPREGLKAPREYAPQIVVPLDSPLQIRRARRRIEEIGRGVVPTDGEEKDTLIREVISHLRSITAKEDANNENKKTNLEILKQTCYATIEKLAATNIAQWTNKYPPRDEIDRQESESVVRVGLYKAVERFSHEFQNTFIVYATRTVTGELQHYFRDKAVHASGIPRDQFELVISLEKIISITGGSLEDAIEELGIDPDKAAVAMKNVSAYRQTTSLDIPEVSRTTAGQTDNIFSPELLIEGSLLEESLQKALTKLNLSKRELLILRQRLGIARADDGNFYNDAMYDKRSQSEISSQIGVSQVHVSRIIRNIISRLQTELGIEPGDEEMRLPDILELFNFKDNDLNDKSDVPEPIRIQTPKPVIEKPARPNRQERQKENADLKFDEITPTSREVGGKVGIDPVGRYLQEIGRFPLLTAQQEVELAGEIAAGVAARQRLANNPEGYTPEQKAIDRKLDRLGAAAKQEFIQANLRLVVHVAKRYQAKAGTGLELLDIIQEGNLGLEHAVDKFDANKGFKFSTYAMNWIRQSINRGINRSARLIRIADDTIDNDIYTLSNPKNAGMTDEDLLEEFGWEPEYLKKLRRMQRTTQTVSTEKPVGNDDSVFGDFISDSNSTQAYEDSEREALLLSFFNILKTILTDREMKILQMRSGLGESGEHMSYAEIGNVLGVTPEAARRHHKRIIAKLHEPDNFAKLGHFKVLLDD